MSDLRRHRPYLIWGAVLVGVAIAAVAALVPAGAWVALDQRRSSLRTTPDGVAAWAQAIERLGVPVAPRHGSFTEEPPRGGALVLLEPVVAPSAAEVHAVLEWVRAGGTLVYSPFAGALIMDSLGLDVAPRISDPYERPRERDVLAPHRWGVRDLSSEPISLWTLEADSAVASRWERLALAGDTGQPTVVWLPVSAGGALVLSDAEELANGSLGASVAAIAVTRALADLVPAGDTVFFSEFHQALDDRRGILREALAIAAGSGPGRAVMYLALMALVVFLLAGRRFGSPLPEREGARRSTLEHLEALAEIYRAAGSQGTVARRLIRGAARRMGLPPGPGGGSEHDMLIAWGSRSHLADPAAAALGALRSTPPDLPSLERALDTLVARHDSFRRP